MSDSTKDTRTLEGLPPRLLDRLKDNRKRPREDEPVIEEKTECFLIETDNLPLEPYGNEHTDLGLAVVDDAARMTKSPVASEEDVKNLWAQKDRLDSVFDDSSTRKYYYDARNSIFPQDERGSNHHLNRAGDKLEEVLTACGGLDGIKKFAFVDCCGGPGAFSDLLLKVTSTQLYEQNDQLDCLHGYGITLKLEDTPTSDMWYQSLRKTPKFTISFGEDGTGDVYNLKNLQDVCTKIKDKGHTKDVLAFVADGGFEIRSKHGRHMENYQELFSGRILLSEVLCMLMTLQSGGHFVCKLFDTFSHLTVSLIFVVATLFKECHIVKPRRSRIVNSERYLVGKTFDRSHKSFELLLQALTEAHTRLREVNTGDPHEFSVKSVVPIDAMEADKPFMNSMKKMVGSLCAKQTSALKVVVDKTYSLMGSRSSYGDDRSRSNKRRRS